MMPICNKPLKNSQLELRVYNVHFFSGASFGLNNPCVKFELGIKLPDLITKTFFADFRCWLKQTIPEIYSVLSNDSLINDSTVENIARLFFDYSVAVQKSMGWPNYQKQVVYSLPSDHFMLVIEATEQESVNAILEIMLRLFFEGMCRCLLLPLADSITSQPLSEWLSMRLDALGKRAPLPNTMAFISAAIAHDIPWSCVDGAIYQLGQGYKARRLKGSFTDQTATLATMIALDKMMALNVLKQAGLPIPAYSSAQTREQAIQTAARIGYPVVIKPLSQDQGRGVTAGLKTADAVGKAYDFAKCYGTTVLVEKHINGDDHRLLIVNGRLLAAVRRIPGGVVGDGLQSISELVAEVNRDPRRGTDKALLICLVLDDAALELLTEAGLTINCIVAKGVFVRLRSTSNLSTGGLAVDVTDIVHPDNRIAAVRAASAIGLDIAGIDFLIPDITQSFHDVGGAICEVNAQPGFRAHWLSQPDRDLNGEILNDLFKGDNGRIPVAAITGTNGKSTVAKMLHHIWMTDGKVAGVCTTNGVWIGKERISRRNLSGFPGGRILLGDASVQAAVIEMPRKGLMVFGHPCDRYDVAALLNVQDDHIGEYGINNLVTMAQLKAEVLQRARNAVVINAEDPLCLAMRAQVTAPRCILVARNADVPALCEHLKEGGAGVFAKRHFDQDWLVLAEGTTEIILMPLADMPSTMNGLLRFNEINALFAAALAWAQGIALETIRLALTGFTNSVDHNIGRFNFIEGMPFRILLDYAHNPDGAAGLCEFVTGLPVTGKRYLVSVNLGSRFAAHLDACAPMLASCFDVFVVGQDAVNVAKSKDWSGDDPYNTMLEYFRKRLCEAGVVNEFIMTERDEVMAIRRGLLACEAGDLLVLLVEPDLALSVLESMFAEPSKAVR